MHVLNLDSQTEQLNKLLRLIETGDLVIPEELQKRYDEFLRSNTGHIIHTPDLKYLSEKAQANIDKHMSQKRLEHDYRYQIERIYQKGLQDRV